MKNFKFIGIYLLLTVVSLSAEAIAWTDTTAHFSFPAGIKLFYGRRNSPALNIWVLDVDLNHRDLAVRPYITTSTANVRTLALRFNVYAAVNGGYFGGATSYSAVIYPNELKAKNIGAVTRNSQSYPLMRSLFSVNEEGKPAVDWIYHYGSNPEQTYRFDEPMSYIYNDPNPKPAPSSAGGTPMDDILVGIGGGPTLVKNGQVHVTYNEEIMWGSGVGLDNADPRTAVGFTADNHVIMVTADGRQTVSQGVSLPELAQIMISFGCVEAMNLDGGGSAQMAVPGININTPSENRSVPT
ncbi:MAG TPA: phosphodiester glycosidase family protein, partial [Candidatus Marinimicrobia bacterium]|nr:phosphodiester glycosidase family protein [Candidatus Neomarinimicrobiota bacterium]